MKYKQQIERIKEKLTLAKKKDANCKTFGASSHRYEVHSEKDIEKLESVFNIELPADFKYFLTEIGFGAGPDYGIYSVDAMLTLTENYDTFKPCILFSEKWSYDNWDENIEELEETIVNHQDILEKVYAGTLTIGTSGCSGYFGIILNGKHTGKVFLYNTELDYPYLTFEDNFIDWYENWLDDVISGRAIKGKPTFGYRKPSENPFKTLLQEENKDTLSLLLQDIYALEAINKHQATTLVDLYNTDIGIDVKYDVLKIVASLYYDLAKPLIKEILLNFDHILYSTAIGVVNCNIEKHHKEDWVSLILMRLKQSIDVGLFRTINYILNDTNYDYTDDILPFCNSKDKEIRKISFYSLGKIKNKNEQLIKTIKQALETETDDIITIIQTVDDKMNSLDLIPQYLKALQNNRENKHILSNVSSLLDALGEIAFTESIKTEIIRYINLSDDIYSLNTTLGILERNGFIEILTETTKHKTIAISNSAKGLVFISQMKVQAPSDFKLWLTTHPFVLNEFYLLIGNLFFQFEKGNEYYKMNFLYLIILGKFEGYYSKQELLSDLQDDLYDLRHLVTINSYLVIEAQ